MTQPQEIAAFCDELLDAAAFDDYCPNGLQVEGTQPVRRLATGVTASLALIDAAAEWRADALLVHHGYFWKGESSVITGMKGARIRALLTRGMSLLAYHLPLDAHAAYGNNALLFRKLRLTNARLTHPAQGLLWSAELETPMTACELSQRIDGALGRSPLHIPGGPLHIRRIGWCTGAAQSLIDEAADAGLDAFISGEISEPTVHIARERGIHYFAAGHHATERFGVQALGDHLGAQFGIETRFFDIDNPV